jgi:hypothetical protein
MPMKQSEVAKVKKLNRNMVGVLYQPVKLRIGAAIINISDSSSGDNLADELALRWNTHADLLAALQELLDISVMEDHGNAFRVHAAEEKARAAIARAKDKS